MKLYRQDIVTFLFTFTRKHWKDMRAYNKVFEALQKEQEKINIVECFQILRALSDVDLQKEDIEEFALGKFMDSRAFTSQNLSSGRLVQLLRIGAKMQYQRHDLFNKKVHELFESDNSDQKNLIGRITKLSNPNISQNIVRNLIELEYHTNPKVREVIEEKIKQIAQIDTKFIDENAFVSLKTHGFSLGEQKDKEVTEKIRSKDEQKKQRSSKRSEMLKEAFHKKLGEEAFEQLYFANANSLISADIYIPSRNVAIMITDRNNTYYSQVDPNVNYIRRERYLAKDLPAGVKIYPLNIYELHNLETEAK